MKKPIPDNALVLVADGRKAILLRYEREGMLRELRRLSPKNLLDDGPSGSRPEDQTRTQTDEATFAKQMSEVLYRMKHSGEFESLVIVADPQTLGQLRDTMHQTVEKCIVRTIAKDLTNHSVSEITDALK